MLYFKSNLHISYYHEKLHTMCYEDSEIKKVKNKQTNKKPSNPTKPLSGTISLLGSAPVIVLQSLIRKISQQSCLDWAVPKPDWFVLRGCPARSLEVDTQRALPIQTQQDGDGDSTIRDPISLSTFLGG